MFARTFSIKAKDVDLDDHFAVLSILERNLSDLVGRKPFAFRFFVDCDRVNKKIVFYDTSHQDHVIEFSTLFQRLPEYSIECDSKTVRIYHFHAQKAAALAFNLVGSPVVTSVAVDEEALRSETAALATVASMTEGFIQTAIDLSGTVVASAVKDESGSKYPFFTVKIDAKSGQNRAILRSCEKMTFAWGDTDTSFMVFMCRFKMLPPFALTFPLIGKNVDYAAELYVKSKKGVGMVMYTDDVSDAFRLENSKPTFEVET